MTSLDPAVITPALEFLNTLYENVRQLVYLFSYASALLTSVGTQRETERRIYIHSYGKTERSNYHQGCQNRRTLHHAAQGVHACPHHSLICSQHYIEYVEIRNSVGGTTDNFDGVPLTLKFYPVKGLSSSHSYLDVDIYCLLSDTSTSLCTTRVPLQKWNGKLKSV